MQTVKPTDQINNEDTNSKGETKDTNKTTTSFHLNQPLYRTRNVTIKQFKLSSDDQVNETNNEKQQKRMN